MTANILIVDDLEPNLKLLEAKLLSEYYTVFTAISGKEALDILKNKKIDIVLLDVMMPDMDGFETCRLIKANPATTHIPVVMVTALSDVEDRVRGLESGADELLTKPINDTALFARIKSLARMKSILDELKLRNQTNKQLGLSAIKFKDNFSKSKILLINDDVVQVKNISKIIGTICPSVNVLPNITSIEDLEDYIPDIVILSCQLEKSDPLRISVMLRSNEDFRNTAIMLLAEEENIPMVIKGMELGVNDYFLYPVDESELLARLKTQLRRKQYQDHLRNELEQSVNLSIKDGLTGVFNRHYFDTHIQQMTKQSNVSNRPLWLLIFDIDDFKHVNDTYGHQTGDTFLKSFTEILKKLFRVTDLMARYGGEEFAVLINDTSEKEAKIIAERARKSIEDAEFNAPSQQTQLKKTVSIGLTQYKQNETIESFIERADKALYQAKKTGKNKVITY